MREGIEIDTSEIITTIERGTVLFALERRVNSSSIARYKVFHNNKIGWVSERIRGGNEDQMVLRVTISAEEDVTPEMSKNQSSVLELISPGVGIKNIQQGMKVWSNEVSRVGFIDMLSPQNILCDPKYALSDDGYDCYLSLCRTYDGATNWTLELDIKIAELLSITSANNSCTPLNLTILRFIEALNMLKDDHLLFGISSQRIIARASLLRVFNMMVIPNYLKLLKC